MRPTHSFLFAAAICALVCGCDSSSTPPDAASSGKSTNPPGLNVNPNDPGVITEDRLESIDAALLLYLQANRQFPCTLADLQVEDANLILVNSSGEQYIYIPGGLSAANIDKRLYVYDPEQLPNGQRWGIVASSFRPGAAMDDEVVHMSDNLFRQYLASGAGQ